MQNVYETIVRQYSTSPTLVQLIDSMNQYFDPSINFKQFYDFVWNIDTAKGFGLDIWGKIVNVGRYLTVPADDNAFGFKNAGDGIVGFDQAPFYSTQKSSQTYRLDDDVYRTLILTKALSNVSLSTSASINQLLRNLFYKRGKCYVRDDGGMHITYVFEFLLKPYEMAFLQQSNVVPHPAGVSTSILQIDVPTSFEFEEADGTPFGIGTFYYTQG